MQKTADFFDLIYKDFKRAPWGYDQPDNALVEFLKQLNLKSRLKALDIGCGNGKNTAYLEKNKFEIFGCDISYLAVAGIKKRLSKGHFALADIISLPFKGGSFDFVLAMGILNFLEQPGQIAVKKEIFRVLKPNAYLIIQTFESPAGRDPGVPLYYLNADGLVGLTAIKDPKRRQVPVWGSNIDQIKESFSGAFKIKDKIYAEGMITVLLQK